MGSAAEDVARPGEARGGQGRPGEAQSRLDPLGSHTSARAFISNAARGSQVSVLALDVLHPCRPRRVCSGAAQDFCQGRYAAPAALHVSRPHRRTV